MVLTKIFAVLTNSNEVLLNGAFELPNIESVRAGIFESEYFEELVLVIGCDSKRNFLWY